MRDAFHHANDDYKLAVEEIAAANQLDPTQFQYNPATGEIVK